MAYVKHDVMKVSTAYFFFKEGAGDAAAPPVAKLGDIAAIEALDYRHIGHTSIEQAVEVETEGGEIETSGTLQVPDMFSDQTPTTKHYIVKVVQWDTANLKLAYGANAVTRADGSIGQNIFPTAVTGAFLMVVVTPSAPVYLHAPLAEVRATKDLGSLGGRGSFGELPLRITPKLMAGQSAKTFTLPLDKATGA
ncbi:hypothetical protein LG274_02690 [Micrococcus antarcticus]|uniref:phage tail tube protein n=1 Tax=Micrococcus antarcticus TaxID=86171 RepID=UPI0038515CED